MEGSASKHPTYAVVRACKSTPYTAYPRRFFMGLQANNDIATIAERMLTINDLLQALEPLNKRLAGLEQGQQGLKQDVAGLKQSVVRVETGQGQLSGAIKTLDLRVETVHEYQKKAHAEIMDRLFESNEANGQEQQRLERRIERIEKHLGLPPLK